MSETPVHDHPTIKALLAKRSVYDKGFADEYTAEQRALRRLRAATPVLRATETARTAEEVAQERAQQAAADRELAEGLAAGRKLVQAPPAEIELARARKAMRLYKRLIIEVDEEIEVERGKIFEQVLLNAGDRIRTLQRRKAEARAAEKRIDTELGDLFGEMRAAGHRFFDVDLLRRFAP